MTEDNTLEYYLKVLGVSRGASFNEIRKEFSKQLKDNNPHNSSDPIKQKRARELIEAYKYIKNKYNNGEINKNSKISVTYPRNSRELSNEKYTKEHYELAKILDQSLPLLKMKYNVYIILNSEEDIDFLDWLRQEVKVRKLCQEIGKSKEVLMKDYKHYKSLYKNSSPLKFVDWLEGELRIINICKSLGKTKDELVIIYLSELMSLKIPNITFEVWLLNKKFNNQDKGFQKVK